MRRAVAIALVVAALAGCSSASPRPHPARPLSKAQACRRLRDDLKRNRGVADVATLSRIADHVTAPRMAADARTAVRDMDHTGMAPAAVSLLRDDCARAGVQIPAP